MSTERKIPERFLVAERAAVENALRRGIWAAIVSHKQSGGFLASWEGGRVVLVPASTVYSLERCPDRETFQDDYVLDRKHERFSLLSNVRNVYVKDETFLVVYSNRKEDPYLYRSPEGFVRELRDICYELTGRDMDIRVVEEAAPGGEELLLLDLPKLPPRAGATSVEDAILAARNLSLLPTPRREPPFRNNPGGAAEDAPSRRES